jgi:hypothetical protein
MLNVQDLKCRYCKTLVETELRLNVCALLYLSAKIMIEISSFLVTVHFLISLSNYKTSNFLFTATYFVIATQKKINFFLHDIFGSSFYTKALTSLATVALYH